MKEILSWILIVVGITIYTITLFIFLEIPANYRIALIIGECLICMGMSILTSERKK